MARNSFPGMKTGGGLLPKLIGLLVLIAVGVLIVRYPGDSAGWVSGVFSGGRDVVDGIAVFLRKLIG
ncbi:hypothetical protein M8C13_36330 [Crossiella sp. SN42]|uniref:hypothetical protein n=1 Tax=Crossiella sp. SN42 TaxID=2944808 RepID=UPI00207D2357|nr:hypothetical protein [Crossiella sp. SN42]MCO1581232.1 hypothetical protein [Crossiella sp. SN42]